MPESLPKPLSAPCPLAQHAAEYPQALALCTPERRWTYAALDATVAHVARALRGEGIEAGMRVSLRWPRSASAIVLIAALARLGAVVAPLSLRLPPAGAVDACRRIGAAVLLTREPPLLDAAASAGLRTLSLAPADVGRPSPQSETSSAASIHPERPATLIFTSGSTGTPKAVLHTWKHHAASARGSAANLPLAPGDRWLLSLPLYHVGGLAILVRCVLAGATVVLPSGDAPLAGTLAQHRITHASLVPTQLRRLLRTADRAPGSLKGVLLGGAALPPDLVDAALDAGWPLHTTYGCTEMASQIATTPPDAARDQLLHTAGRVLPHARLRVDDRGALLVRGASLFDGYVEGRSLHPARTSDGWYRTGDLGFLDGDGFLHVEGRTDRMFISGGENIQPEEIETALQRLDGVEQAAVVPVPNDAFGARPVAFVRMRGNTLSEEELLRRLEGVLPRYKLPVAFFPLPDAALHGQMKLDRQQLEQQARRLLYEQPPDAPDAS